MPAVAAEDPTWARLNAAPGHSSRGSVARACAALTGALVLALLGAGNARAGEWVQASCVNPNQTAAGSAGWSSFASGGGYGSTNSSSCEPGSPAYALLSTDAPVVVGSEETLQYTPPAGSTLNGGQLDLAMDADGHGYNASGTAVAYTPEYVYNGNVFFQCAAGLQPCAGFGNDFTGQLELPAGRGGNLYLSAGCGGESSPHLQSCNEGGSNGAWSLIDLWWANLRLSNDATPAASGVAGTLLDPDARGGRELTFTATDPAGPGVYNVTVQLDGQTLHSATPDSNGGQCVPVGEDAGTLMFDASQPCKQSESVDVPIETSAVPDGQHTLKVTVTDAAQNTSVVYDATISTQNAPANTVTPAVATVGELLPGDALSAEPGQWSAPTGTGATTLSYQWQDCNEEGAGCRTISGGEGNGYTATVADVGHSLRALVTATDSDGSTSAASPVTAVVNAPLPVIQPTSITTNAGAGLTAGSTPGAPNGSGANEDAQLHLAGHPTITRGFASRALTITGQLASASGSPVANATLDIREQVNGAGSPKVVGHTSTAANGSFTVHVAPGPSRLVLVDYRAFSSDALYSAQAGVRENVAADVQMHVTPRRSAPSGRILLSGRVAGPVPQRGVVVEILVRYRGVWEPLRTPRTDTNGRFNVAYQFQGAVGRFPFRAEVFGGQAGYPYARGQSTTLAVTTD
jgi:hypothetical protein